jgi:hypothetical protein
MEIQTSASLLLARGSSVDEAGPLTQIPRVGTQSNSYHKQPPQPLATPHGGWFPTSGDWGHSSKDGRRGLALPVLISNSSDM